MKPLALLINKFIPPDEAPTARLLGDVGDCFIEAGWDVEYLGRTSGYRTQSRGLAHRVVDEISFHLQILGRTLFRRKASLLISLTSPPGLVFTVSLLSKLTGARHIHWCMDLYPDIAVALGALKQRSWINRIWESVTNWAYDGCSHVVALDEDMRERFSKKGVTAKVQAPWAPDPGQFIPSTSRADNILSDERNLWLYSGNLGRAHEWKTLLTAQGILEKRGSSIRLVFQGGGPEMPLAKKAAEELSLSRVEWRDYAPKDQLIGQLLSAKALVVTQRPESVGMLYPSKLNLAEPAGTPMIWVGDIDCSIARRLSHQARYCLASPGDATKIADFIEGLQETPADLETRFRNLHLGVNAQKQEGHQFWVELAQHECSTPSN